MTDEEGRRHSIDVQAASLFDVARLFVVEAKKEPAVGLPKPTLATVFRGGDGREGISGDWRRASALDCGEPELTEWTDGQAFPAEAGAGAAGFGVAHVSRDTCPGGFSFSSPFGLR